MLLLQGPFCKLREQCVDLSFSDPFVVALNEDFSCGLLASKCIMLRYLIRDVMSHDDDDDDVLRYEMLFIRMV